MTSNGVVGVLWTNGAPHILPSVPHDGTVAPSGGFDGLKINIHKTSIVNGLSHVRTPSAAIFDPATGLISTLPVPVNTALCYSTDLNDNNIAIGYAFSTNNRISGLVWHDNVMDILLPVSGFNGGDAQPYGINNKNQIVGMSAANDGNLHMTIWRNNIPARISPDLSDARPIKINDNQQIVACSYSFPTKLFVLSESGWTAIGSLYAGDMMLGQGFNNKGWLVGMESDLSGSAPASGFLWKNGSLVNLNSIIQGTSYTVDLPHGINNKDQIVAESYATTPHGLLLNPVIASVPTLSEITPAAIPLGEPAVLTLLGSGFEDDTTVIINDGPELTATYLSPTKMIIKVSAEMINKVGALSVKLYTPPTGGGYSNSKLISAYCGTRLDSVTPKHVNLGAKNATITLTGVNFTSDSVVTINDKVTAATTVVVSPTTIKAILPATVANKEGSYYVRVVSPAFSVHSNALPFTVERLTPTIAAISPDRIPAGLARFAVTIHGTGFTPSSQVSFDGGTPVTPTSVQPNTLIAPIPASILATAGNVTVRIINSFADGGVSSLAYMVIAPRPVLTSITPSTVLTTSKLVTLTLLGTSFEAGSIVTFNGVYATAPEVLSASVLKVVVPSAATKTHGTYQVCVVNSGYTNYSSPKTLTITAAPKP